MNNNLFDILEFASKAKTKQERADILKANESFALKSVLQLAYNPNVVAALPEGAPPYKPCEVLDTEGRLYQEARTLPLYLYGNRPDLKQVQRENLFIGLLESLHPKDASLLIAVKDKKVEGLNVATINEAFPGLIPNE